MPSISLSALPGASVLIQSTPHGIAFRMENSGSSVPSQLQDAPEIMLTAGPDGVRLCVISKSHRRSSVEQPPPWSIATSDSTNVPSPIPTWLEDSLTAMSEQQHFFFDKPFSDTWSPAPLLSNSDQKIDSDSSMETSVFDFTDSSLLLPTGTLTGQWAQDTPSSSEASSPYPSPASPFTELVAMNNNSSNNTRSPDSPSTTSKRSKLRFPCRQPGCDRFFMREYTRKVHEEAHSHKLVMPLFCREPGCSTTFSRQHDRLRHEVMKHGHSCDSCDRCGKIFSSERSLNKHKCQPTPSRLIANRDVVSTSVSESQ